jgi:hypothetical protein
MHGEKIYMELPILRNTGILSSSRKIYIKDTLVFADPASKLRSIVHFGHEENIDVVDGFITEIPDNMNVHELIQNNLKRPWKKRKELKKLILEDLTHYCEKITLRKFSKTLQKGKLKHLSIISEIKGAWTDQLMIDGQVGWTKQIKRFAPQLEKDPIPSDFRFREDILWMVHGNIGHAQRWKLRLEAAYRKERKTREKLNEKRQAKGW